MGNGSDEFGGGIDDGGGIDNGGGGSMAAMDGGNDLEDNQNKEKIN